MSGLTGSARRPVDRPPYNGPCRRTEGNKPPSAVRVALKRPLARLSFDRYAPVLGEALVTRSRIVVLATPRSRAAVNGTPGKLGEQEEAARLAGEIGAVELTPR